jgi:hypothetical protein
MRVLLTADALKTWRGHGFVADDPAALTWGGFAGLDADHQGAARRRSPQ